MALPIAQPAIRRAGKPNTTKNKAGSQVISAGVSSTFKRNNGKDEVRVKARAIQHRNGERPISLSTGHTSTKARIRPSFANHTCRNGRSRTTNIISNAPSRETKIPALCGIREARTIKPTGKINQSTVPAKPRAPSQNNRGNCKPATVFHSASRAVANLLDSPSQKNNLMGAGQTKWRNFPPRINAQAICSMVMPVTTQSATIQNPAFSGDTTIAESRRDANIRAGQSTSQTPRIAPPSRLALRTPTKPSRNLPVLAICPQANSK